MRHCLGVFLLGTALLTSAGDAAAKSLETWSVLSPDGRIAVELSLEDGVPGYAVSHDGRPIVLRSRLGFRFRTAPPLTDGLAMAAVTRDSLDEIWEPVWGTASEIRNHYNELVVLLEETEEPRREMSVVVRAYDDGVGFRYVLPEQPNLDSFDVMSEETEFRFADNHTAWWIPADYDSYEHLYRRTHVASMPAANTPVTLETLDGLFVSIHEANLTNYPGMTLAALEGVPHALRAELVPWPDGTKAARSTPFESPWRTIQIGERPGDLVESHLILNLNEPCALDDTSWIRPMKYVGIWWGMHIGKYTWHQGPDHGATTENAKRHVDFAQAHGFDAVLIEGWNTGWNRWGAKGAFDYVTPYDDFDLEEVAAYARERGISIIGHHETGGDAEGYELFLDQAFDLYARLGVPAVKTGYAGGIYPRGQHHHGQWMVYHYRKVLEKAAEKRIMLDVHEPIKPTGIERTYPNMMTREGVRGMEYNAWSEGNPPEHTTILPFTRMLAGPLDYTPGIFDLTFEEHKPDNRVHTTLAKQLALFVVLFSPVQMAADLPENYEGHPAFEFVERVPCDWDETRVIDARIGDFVTIARRRGEEWYLGSVTDEESRELSASLEFLEPGLRYAAKVFRDAETTDLAANPTAVEMDTIHVTSEDTLSLRLAAGGGQAIWFSPE